MIVARFVLRALAATGCVLAIAGCSFEGGIDTAPRGTSAVGGPPAAGSTASPSTPASPAPGSPGTSAASGPAPDPVPDPASDPAPGSSAPAAAAPAPSTAEPPDAGPTAVAAPPPAAPSAAPGSGAPAGQSGGSSPTKASSSSSSSATDPCHSGDLVGRLATEDSTAGQRHAMIELRNISGRTCQVRGYGGVQLVDQYQQALPTQQVRVPSPAPAVVTVASGGTATSQLAWAAVPGDADAATGPCQPTPTTLSVIPPDETQPLAVSWDLGPVCQGGTIQQQPYR